MGQVSQRASSLYASKSETCRRCAEAKVNLQHQGLRSKGRGPAYLQAFGLPSGERRGVLGSFWLKADQATVGKVSNLRSPARSRFLALAKTDDGT